MNNKSSFIPILTTLLIAVFIVPSTLVQTKDILNLSINRDSLTSSVFFQDSKNVNDLISRYKSGGKVRILIIPGHDDQSWGTEFNGLREADVNLFIAKNMYDDLSKDTRLSVFLTRDSSGYMPGIKDYFTNKANEVWDFISKQKVVMTAYQSTGQVQTAEGGVIHNSAKSDVALRLYSVNKWANDNAIDIVISIHINDNSGRRAGEAGEYNGFTVYIPEKQFSNARASKPLGDAVASRLKTVIPQSNLPREGDVVEDQSLIAIGAYNSLDAASLLIEYGYIYEPQYTDTDRREAVSKEYAYLTSLAVQDYLSGTKNTNDVSGVLSKLDSFQEKGDKGGDVVSLQSTLALLGSYPGEGTTIRDCYVTGVFGPCTEKGVKDFQNKYGLEETGTLGPKTLTKINALLSK